MLNKYILIANRCNFLIHSLSIKIKRVQSKSNNFMFTLKLSKFCEFLSKENWCFLCINQKMFFIWRYDDRKYSQYPISCIYKEYLRVLSTSVQNFSIKTPRKLKFLSVKFSFSKMKKQVAISIFLCFSGKIIFFLTVK